MAAEEKNEPLKFMVVKLENQKIPEYKQVRGKDWIYWGENNNYPDYLIELFHRSSTHNAIITGKVDYILGEGWTADKRGLSVVDRTKLNTFVQNINKDQSLNELSEPVCLDFELFNAIPLCVIYNKAKTDFELHHVPLNKIRTDEKETKYWYSEDWSQTNQSEEKTGLKEYKKFDFELKENGIYIFKIVAPRKGKDPNVYPTPGYVGSTQAIETQIECSNYNLTEIKTGFSAGTMINFYNGQPTEEEKKKIEKLIKDKFSGTDRAGSIILNFSDGKDRGSESIALAGNDLPERYIEIKKDSSQDIFTGHKVSSPMLFGVKTEGQLGGRSEMIEAYELFQNTYVSKRQRILEKVFNKFAKLKGLKANLQIKPTAAIGYGIPDSLIAQALPIDLVKEKLGIPVKKELADGSKIIIDSLNSLSPLVATKVLENMTAEEIRSLVHLSGPVTTTTSTVQTDTQTAMSAHMDFDSQIIDRLASFGKRKSEYEIFKSKEIDHADYFKVAKIHNERFKKKDDLTGLDRSIIDLLNKDNHLPAEEIAKALKVDKKNVQQSIERLVAGEYLTPYESEGQSVYEPSGDAIDTVDNDGAKTVDIEVLYSYELRTNAPALLPGGTSRPFCKKLIDLNLLYTKEEIDGLANEFGTDVWAYKGGWYTNPKTDAPTPQCRHIWVQNIVKRKN